MRRLNFFGAILLMMGSCIGAGMLGLPIMTGLGGFFPSLLMFLVAWLFMTLTGFLLIEVHSGFDTRVNFISMVKKTLGKPGQILSWILYLFLFYSLLVAYISGTGALIVSIFHKYLGVAVNIYIVDLLFVGFFGVVVYLGTRPVDLCNRLFMFVKIAAFLGLVKLGVGQIRPQLLTHVAPQYAVFSLPILIISFGFHNMLPTLAHYVGGNLRRLRLIVLIGGGSALVIYLLWQLVVLGIVPLQGEYGIFAMAKKGGEASEALMGILGNHFVSYFATLLGLFALLTSFLGQALSLSHFLSDGLNQSYQKHEQGWMVVLTLLPPLILALVYPNIFLKALNFAGGICAVILFGVLPVLMVWRGRYHKKHKASYQLKGGKPLLVALFVVALCIACFELIHMFRGSYLP